MVLFSTEGHRSADGERSKSVGWAAALWQTAPRSLRACALEPSVALPSASFSSHSLPPLSISDNFFSHCISAVPLWWSSGSSTVARREPFLTLLCNTYSFTLSFIFFFPLFVFRVCLLQSGLLKIVTKSQTACSQLYPQRLSRPKGHLKTLVDIYNATPFCKSKNAAIQKSIRFECFATKVKNGIMIS